MPPGKRGRKAQKDDLNDNIKAAKERTGLRNYEHLFIFPNAEAIRNSSNIQDQSSLKFTDQKFGELKIAFEPLGQSKPNATQEKSSKDWFEKLTTGKEAWPEKVPGFELWAEATGYDPTKPDGGQVFQNMLNFLLVQEGGMPQFSGKKYYTIENKRGPGWYKGKKGPFKGTPHSLKLRHELWATKGAWHTPETQGLVNLPNPKHEKQALEMVGGTSGAWSNTDNGFIYNEEEVGKITIGAPYRPGSKLNWLYHCFGALVIAEEDAKPGNHTGSDSFVTAGGTVGCNEESKSCTSAGNNLAAIIGLYYYPGCDKYNWTTEQTPIANGKSYTIRMRMWNPNYEYNPVSQDLLVKEKINSSWSKNWLEQDANPEHPYVGSNNIKEAERSGFRLAHIYKSEAKLASTSPNEDTPPQPLKQLVQRSEKADGILASISPWFGEVDDSKFVVSASKPHTRQHLVQLHKHLGDLVNKPGDLQDDLLLGFRVPKAHFLYPQWGDNVKKGVPGKKVKKHTAMGFGFQPVPSWARDTMYLNENVTSGHKLRVTDEAQIDGADAKGDIDRAAAKMAKQNLVSAIKEYGLAIALLDIKKEARDTSEYQAERTKEQKKKNGAPLKVRQWSIPALNNIAYALGEQSDEPVTTQPPAPADEAAVESNGSEDESSEEEEEDKPIGQMLVRELRAELQGRGLDTSGLKAELVERLSKAREQHSDDPDNDPAPSQDSDDPEDKVLPLDKEEGVEGEEGEEGQEPAEHNNQEQAEPTDTGEKGIPNLTPLAIYHAETGVEIDLSKDHQSSANEFLNQKGVKDILVKKELLPGATARPDIDFNHHFSSSEKQPWPHKDLYSESKVKIVPSEVMDAAALAEFEDKYGSAKNCYLRGEKLPTKIIDIVASYGKALATINTNLFADTPLHRKNMCKILAIYFDTDDMGGKRSTFSKGEAQVTAKDKRRCMMGGIKREKGKLFARTGTEIWPAVFHFVPPAKLRLTVKEVNAGRISTCNLVEFEAWYSEHNGDGPMKVLEWVTSPWHYAYLPYHKRDLLFEDGETYSEGCTRCSRPFYEYQHMYSWFLQGPQKTAHWPTMYWCVTSTDGGACDPTKAPKPFHHKDFWQTPVGGAQTKKRSTTELNDSDTPPSDADSDNCPDDYPPTEKGSTMSGRGAGWHNWPTFAFKFGQKADGHTYTANGRLVTDIHRETKGEYNKKKGKLPDGILKAGGERQDLLFKRYHNHAYRPERLDFWGGSYPSYPQSRAASGNAKLQLGMEDYNLQRASKYGNVCHDCATVLELAPGLLGRLFRRVPYTIGSLKPKVPGEFGDNSYWTRLLKEIKETRGGPVQDHLLRPEKMLNFDIDDLKVPKAMRQYKKGKHNTRNYDEIFTKSMRTYSRLIADQQNVDLGRNGAGAPLTKFNSPPDIYLPKQIDLKAGTIGEIDHKQIDQAVKFLQDMRPTYVGNKVVMPGFWTDEDDAAKAKRKAVSELPAFQHMIFELERKYMHLAQFERDTSNKVFDSEMTRLESRNETCTLNGKVYKNCLVVKYLSPPVMVNGVLRPQKTTSRTYHYDAATESTPPVGSPDETMWRGDNFVREPGTGNRKSEQYRKMRQSRLFITYSLHRATTSEDEARFLMMRMADAAHCLFGNDQNLSELLVFGHKVVAVNKVDGAADSLSKGGFARITAPKKKDQEANFYGDDTGSSYIYDTYQTHVEKVDVDGGIEIGPQRHHPHFHILLTINHYSYIQLDYFKMNVYLEMMFKGTDKLCKGWDDKFKLLDASGNLFYTDNENPYVDIKLYPQDNWNDIISAYVRKNATPGPIEAAQVARDEIRAP